MTKNKFNYFNAFNEQAEMIVKEADLLIDVIKNYTTAADMQETLKKAHDIEHAADQINHKTLTNIARDFITPLDREDLLSLTHTMDNIVDDIEDVIQLFYIYDVHVMQEEALEFAKILKRSCLALQECTKEFPNFKKSKTFESLIVAVNDHEDEADILYMKLIRKLFIEQKKDPMRVIVWSDIYDQMEHCCDACEHASDVISTAALKNS